MPPRASKSAKPSASSFTLAPKVDFPPISQKYLKNLCVENLVENQIVLIHDFFTPQECKAFISVFEQLPMISSPPPKRGEAQRTNDRFSTISPSFAAQLYSSTALDSLVQDWSSQFSTPRRSRIAQGLSENIRVYSYKPGEFFANHYDSSNPSPINPAHASEWTLLVYLSDDVVGGETVFHLPGRKTLSVAPTRGMALLHKHGGHDCLLHEGAMVKKGRKWVLRSDVMFG